MVRRPGEECLARKRRGLGPLALTGVTQNLSCEEVPWSGEEERVPEPAPGGHCCSYPLPSLHKLRTESGPSRSGHRDRASLGTRRTAEAHAPRWSQLNSLRPEPSPWTSHDALTRGHDWGVVAVLVSPSLSSLVLVPRGDAAVEVGVQGAGQLGHFFVFDLGRGFGTETPVSWVSHSLAL